MNQFPNQTVWLIGKLVNWLIARFPHVSSSPRPKVVLAKRLSP